MPFTPLTFTGVSAYSEDLNTVLKRAVAIASLPLTRLQNDDANLLSKKTALGSLSASVGTLASSLTSLGAVANNKALTATSSDSSTVSVAYSGATASATYTISDIASIAKAATEVSNLGYADTTTAPVSVAGAAPGTVKLFIGSQSYTITLTAAQNNLQGLRNAINDLDVGVNASVLTTGTGLTPNYLSLTAGNSGASTLRLVDDPLGTPVELVTNTNQGANASFKLNGIAVSKTTNVINDVVSGATFTILDTTTGAETVKLSLQTNRTQLQSALQDFANKYNSLVDQVGGEVGSAAGVLAGDFLVREIQSSMRQLTSYTGAGGVTASEGVKSLAEVGLRLGQDGKITFDTAWFTSLSDTKISSAFDFLGSSNADFTNLVGKFTQISDPVSGLAKMQQDNYDLADRRIQKDIIDLNDRITDLQTSVTARLQAADALLAQLTSQQNILTASIDALNTVTFGRRTD